MNINIKPELVSTLERLAGGQYQNMEDYASGIVNAHLASQKRNDLIATIDSNLPVFEEVVLAKKEEIRLADEALRVSLEEETNSEATTTPEVI